MSDAISVSMKIITDFVDWVIPTAWFVAFVALECVLIYGFFKYVGAV